MKDTYFTASPFGLTATPQSARCWAGRPSVLQRLERLRRAYQSRPDSSLDVVWANLGAGKSHLLYYFAQLLSAPDDQPGMIASVVEVPDHAKSFLDLYRRIVMELPLPILAKVIANSATDLPADLRKASHALLHGGSTERDLAKDWIWGGHPHIRDLRSAIGVGERIETDQRAADILSAIARACASASIRLVLLLDEFQRLAPLQQKIRTAIQSNIRSVFSANASYFSTVIAIGSRAEQTALEVLPQELRTLMGVRPTVALPEMDEAEALQFIQERLAFFRPPQYSGSALAPLGDIAVKAALAHVREMDGARFTPRNVLQVLGELYDEAMATGTSQLSSDQAAAVLKGLGGTE